MPDPVINCLDTPYGRATPMATKLGIELVAVKIIVSEIERKNDWKALTDSSNKMKLDSYLIPETQESKLKVTHSY
jgi:hypothetical protein